MAKWNGDGSIGFQPESETLEFLALLLKQGENELSLNNALHLLWNDSHHKSFKAMSGDLLNVKEEVSTQTLGEGAGAGLARPHPPAFLFYFICNINIMV